MSEKTEDTVMMSSNGNGNDLKPENTEIKPEKKKV